MRKFHLEIDERRRSGDLKGALDLARYAHAQVPQHQLVKRSYAWALYSYLKHKITSSLSELSSSEWMSTRDASHVPSTHQLLSDHPRRREINLLCREYRRHKLPVDDLCLSLTLRQLCRFSPAPLGLYGLLNWAELKGLRSEDHQVDPEYPEQPPLTFTLAQQLCTLINHLDQERVSGFTSRIEPTRVAKLAAQLYMSIINEDLSSEDEYTPWIISSLWGACWVNRRAGHFKRGLHYACLLVQFNQETPETWWELAQIAAREAHIPMVLTHQGKVNLQPAPHPPQSEDDSAWADLRSPVRQTALNDAISLALRCAHEARSRGVNEVNLSEIYARAGYWSGLLRDYSLAQSLMWWSIELRRQNHLPSPYTWTELLIQYGGAPSEPWPRLRSALHHAITHTQRWMTIKINE